MTGDSIDRVVWFKDKIPTAMGISTRSLKLKAVTASQAGAYECRATYLTIEEYDGYKATAGILLVTGKSHMLRYLIISVTASSPVAFFCLVTQSLVGRREPDQEHEAVSTI